MELKVHVPLHHRISRCRPASSLHLRVCREFIRSNKAFSRGCSLFEGASFFIAYDTGNKMKKINTLVLDVTIYILDFLYRGRDFQRFWVLEVIARAPYFAFISVLHFRESLGLRGEDHVYLMKEHFYQALNETEHLEEMELREGDKYWIDRFFAKHLVLFYYWVMVVYYLIDPMDAYDINMKIEKHAYETYIKYLAYHPEDKKIAEIANDELEHSKELHKAMLLIT